MPAEARDEIPALYARLQDEVLRSEAAARPLVRRPGVRGALVYAAKKLLRAEPRPARARPVTETRVPRGGGRRVAYYSPMPPERSGIADYSALLLPALERLVDVDVAPRGKRAEGDVALYHVGNDAEVHGWIVEQLRREPGVVVLHDFVLHHLVASMTLGRKDSAGYLDALERDSGVAGRLLGLGVIDGCIPPLWEVRPEDFPLCDEVLDSATGVIVHSRYVEERVRERGYDRPVWRVPHPAWPAPDVEPERPSRASRCSAPSGTSTTRSGSRSCSRRSRAFARSQPDARLLLVGRRRRRHANRRGSTQSCARVTWTRNGCGRCSPASTPWFRCARRRWARRRARSIRALSLGKPLLVSDVGWFSELPDDVALKVAPGDGEVERLTRRAGDARRSRRARADGRQRRASSRPSTTSTTSPELYASALQVRALSEAQR